MVLVHSLKKMYTNKAVPGALQCNVGKQLASGFTECSSDTDVNLIVVSDPSWHPPTLNPRLQREQSVDDDHFFEPPD